MLRTLKNAWRVPELRNKLLFTLMIIIVYRLGANIIVPYVSTDILGSFDAYYGGTVLGFMSILSGGALSQATLFALGVNPYITASIVMQLLSIAIPALERMSKDEDGKKKINAITRYVTVALAIVTGFGYTRLLDSNGWLVSSNSKVFQYFVIIGALCAGASMVMWIAEKINEHGIGNGISIILFANIISRLPSMANTLWTLASNKATAWSDATGASTVAGFNLPGTIAAVVIVLVIVALLVASVWFTNSERRIPIQYAKRVVGRKMYGGQGTNLPLKMNMAGVMPIIFASSIVSIPATIVTMFGINTSKGFGKFVNAYLQPNTWTYIVLYLIMLVAFSYFYIMISFNPVEVSNNIRNNGGAVPGIRPGKPTVDYIKKILNRVTLIGAIFLAVIACLPMIAPIIMNLFSFESYPNLGLISQSITALAFGGSSLLIVVGVALETTRDLEAQLTMRNYKGKGFLD